VPEAVYHLLDHAAYRRLVDTSPGTDRASVPVERNASSVSSGSCSSLAAIRNLSSASTKDTRCPMPRAAPVTTATSSLFHSSLLLLDSPEVCDSIATLSLAALYQRAQVRREAFSFISCKGFGHRLT
jgi:hypothetical protein